MGRALSPFKAIAAAKKRCETLSVEAPKAALKDACHTAALGHATITEGIMVITLNSKKLDKQEKKGSLNSCTGKARQHGETLGMSVTDLLEPKLHQEAMQWLLNN